MTAHAQRQRVLPRIALLVCLLIAVAGLLVTSQRFGSETTASASVIDIDHPFLVPSRDHLEICVAVIGEDEYRPSDAGTRERVADAIASISAAPQWSESRLLMSQPTVTAGCPEQAALLRPEFAGQRVTAKGRIEGSLASLRVAEASPFFLFVFALPDEVVDDRFDPLTIRVSSQEMLCSGHVCATATQGLYISYSELEDAQFLTEWLTKGIGLMPVVPYENVSEEHEKQDSDRP